jgi:hypothetical protein
MLHLYLPTLRSYGTTLLIPNFPCSSLPTAPLPLAPCQTLQVANLFSGWQPFGLPSAKRLQPFFRLTTFPPLFSDKVANLRKVGNLPNLLTFFLFYLLLNYFLFPLSFFLFLLPKLQTTAHCLTAYYYFPNSKPLPTAHCPTAYYPFPTLLPSSALSSPQTPTYRPWRHH